MSFTLVYATRNDEGDEEHNVLRADTPAELLADMQAVEQARAKVVEISMPNGRSISRNDLMLFAEKGVIAG